MSIKVNLCCPYCKSKVLEKESHFQCSNSECFHHKTEGWFNSIKGKPILISEHYCDTVFNIKNIASLVSRRKDTVIKEKLNNLIYGQPAITERNCSKFVDLLTIGRRSSNCLVIGSGEKGRGTQELFDCSKVSIFGTDIYESKLVDAVADAHYLPFEDQSFDGVWIQAVLEHVVDPQMVVEEIFRILKPEGIIYAETPFLQQVHEGRYDFNRFTVLGHRYLFKRFISIDIGGNKGAGVALAWSIKYFFWSLFRSKKIGTLLSLPFAIIFRIGEKFIDKRSLYDASSGVYFLGKKSNETVSHKNLVKLYKGMQI
jgi:SAM-dependent methyltransferase